MNTATVTPVAPPRNDAMQMRLLGGFLRFMWWSPLTSVAVIMLAVPIVLAILAPVIAPYDPTLNQYSKLVQEPSAEHIMGTDKLGRDVYSRLLYGTRISLFVAFSAVLLGEALGFVLGVATAYIGGRFDLVTQRLVDVLMSFPTLILAMLLMAGLGASITTIILAI